MVKNDYFNGMYSTFTCNLSNDIIFDHFIYLSFTSLSLPPSPSPSSFPPLCLSRWIIPSFPMAGYKRTIQSPLLPILIQCPSSASDVNKGKHILTTGPMKYSEEKLLFFFGQV